MNTTLKNQIQEVYEKAYNESVIKHGHNIVPIGVTADGHTKVFLEKDFFGCGFNWLTFKAIGKNKDLRRDFETSKHWQSGFYLKCINQLGWRGNGDWPQQTDAYRAVRDFLNGLGYEVNLESVID